MFMFYVKHYIHYFRIILFSCQHVEKYIFTLPYVKCTIKVLIDRENIKQI